MPLHALKITALVLMTPTFVALWSAWTHRHMSGQEVLFGVWLYIGLPALALAVFLLWLDRPIRRINT
jgi:hypothetical protein